MGFVLDLNRIGEGTTRLFESLEFGELEVSWPGLVFGSQLEVAVEVARAGGDLDITLRFAGERRGECDRCLQPFSQDFTGVVRAIGRKASARHPLAGQDGVVFHDGRQLDLTGDLREAVLVDIPIRNLCAEDCQGLCPTCGADLNQGPCGCAVGQVDPRWEALRRARGLG
jgi:uncharacterized protein